MDRKQTKSNGQTSDCGRYGAPTWLALGFQRNFHDLEVGVITSKVTEAYI